MIGLFCRIQSLLQGSFAQETYHFKEPVNRSHPIGLPQPVDTIRTMSIRIDEIIRLFCRIASLLQGSFAKETCYLIDPTNQSHPIGLLRPMDTVRTLANFELERGFSEFNLRSILPNSFLWKQTSCSGLVDVYSRSENYVFLKCCPGTINSCLNSYRLKTSTPQTPKRAKRARARSRYRKETNQIVQKNVGSCDQLEFLKKMLFFNCRKNKNMIKPPGKRARKPSLS